MFRTKPVVRDGQVLFLPVTAIRKNPQQPRRAFDPEELRSLAESIVLYGILQPLTVRQTESGWELVAGERRLRAAKLAGLENIPAITVNVNDNDAAIIALV